MLERLLQVRIEAALFRSPVVAILGSRQVGKTTLARTLTRNARKPTVYLDLERDSDRSKLSDAEDYLGRQSGKLVVLDEIQRRPDLFRLLRSLVDERRATGERQGQFLILGSASRELLQQSSESLAGRIEYFQLAPFTVQELGERAGKGEVERLWLRGGYPLSFLADDETSSWTWRGQFVDTYLERDIPQLGPRIPAERLRRLWSMLALGQGDQLNCSRLATSLGVSGVTVRHYLDLLVDLYVARQLEPWAGNSRKRLVKSPKIYLRDSGLAHRMARVPDLETLLGHPICGRSWEGFAIEQLLAHLPDTWRSSYYRSAAGAEIDLVLEGPRRSVLALEIKRTSEPQPGKGFLAGCEDVGATERWFVIPAGEEHSIGQGTRAVSLPEIARRLAASR